MKKYLLLVSLMTLLIPPSAQALVRLKNVTQSGRGDQGTINIEFTAGYNTSNIKTEYYADHVALILNDAYTTPPSKRIFRSSSPKSSVVRMEASMVPISQKNSATVRLNIYFRIPIDIVKKTSSLVSDDNFIRFNYKVAAPVVVDEPVKTQQAVKIIDDTKPLPDDKKLMGDNEIIDTSKQTKAPKTDKAIRASTILFRALKVIAVLVLLLVFIYLAVFFFKKYTQGRPRMYTAPVNSRPTVPSKELFGADIKVISSSDLEDGKKLYLVEVEGERMLIGASKESLSMVAKLAKSEKQGTMMTEEQETAMKSRLKEKLRNF